MARTLTWFSSFHRSERSLRSSVSVTLMQQESHTCDSPVASVLSSRYHSPRRSAFTRLEPLKSDPVTPHQLRSSVFQIYRSFCVYSTLHDDASSP